MWKERVSLEFLNILLLVVASTIVTTDLIFYFYYSREIEYIIVLLLILIVFFVLTLVRYKFPRKLKFFMGLVLVLSTFYSIFVIIFQLFTFNNDLVRWSYTNMTLEQLSLKVDLCNENDVVEKLGKTVDIYSKNGEFKFIKLDETILLYSVGPDLIDDKAKISLAKNSFSNSIYSKPWRYMLNKFWLYQLSKKSHDFRGDIVVEVDCKNAIESPSSNE